MDFSRVKCKLGLVAVTSSIYNTRSFCSFDGMKEKRIFIDEYFTQNLKR